LGNTATEAFPDRKKIRPNFLSSVTQVYARMPWAVAAEAAATALATKAATEA
jgi:hypothetical protein